MTQTRSDHAATAELDLLLERTWGLVGIHQLVLKELLGMTSL